MNHHTIVALDPNVVNRIAAGEAITSPENAVKELLENSIDAGSTLISIRIEHGGYSMIKISDNGSGINRSDLCIACRRHTTSKLKDYNDLANIGTFGFRGEALFSISCVSHLKIITKTKEDEVGSIASFKNGEVEGKIEDLASTNGTVVEAKDLFYNYPVRLKGIKPNSSSRNISEIVAKYAVINPELGFSLFVDKKETVRTFGKSNCESVLKLLFGVEANETFFKLTFDVNNNVSVGMYLNNPFYPQPKHTNALFINGRLVANDRLKKGIEEVYNLCPASSSAPFYFVIITMPPQNVDVNVHPSKKVVCFLDEKEIIEEICKKVKKALDEKISSCMSPPSKKSRLKPAKNCGFNTFITDYTKNSSEPHSPQNLSSESPSPQKLIPSQTELSQKTPSQCLKIDNIEIPKKIKKLNNDALKNKPINSQDESKPQSQFLISEKSIAPEVPISINEQYNFQNLNEKNYEKDKNQNDHIINDQFFGNIENEIKEQKDIGLNEDKICIQKFEKLDMLHKTLFSVEDEVSLKPYVNDESIFSKPKEEIKLSKSESCQKNSAINLSECFNDNNEKNSFMNKCEKNDDYNLETELKINVDNNFIGELKTNLNNFDEVSNENHNEQNECVIPSFDISTNALKESFRNREQNTFDLKQIGENPKIESIMKQRIDDPPSFDTKLQKKAIESIKKKDESLQSKKKNIFSDLKFEPGKKKQKNQIKLDPKAQTLEQLLSSPKGKKKEFRVVTLDSIVALRSQLTDIQDLETSALFHNSILIGIINVKGIILNNNGTLYIGSIFAILKDYFYAKFLELFANFDVLNVSIKVSDCCPDNAKIINLILKEKSEMLKDYFSLQYQNGIILTMPLISKSFKPSLAGMSLFLNQLVTDVNWDIEFDCFRDLIDIFSKLYSFISNEDGSVIPDNQLSIIFNEILQSETYIPTINLKNENSLVNFNLPNP